MIAFICFFLAVLTSPFKSKSGLEAENAVLRHQLIVLRRKVRGRAQPTNNDRWSPTTMLHEPAHCASRSAVSRAKARWIPTTAWVSEVGHADQAHVSSSAGSGGSTRRLRP
jgi:hypothetical protein